MPMTLQVLYPVGDGISFDHDYYLNTHLPLVGEHMGEHLAGASASKGLAGGPDVRDFEHPNWNDSVSIGFLPGGPVGEPRDRGERVEKLEKGVR